MGRNWSLVSFGKSFFTPAGRQAAANFAWMLAGRIISQTCLVGVILLLTRALGREQFGIFATALALQGYIVLLATAGMPAVVVREAVRRPGEVAQIASTFLAVAWTVGLFAALMLSVTVLFVNISPEEKSFSVILGLGRAIASALDSTVGEARTSSKTNKEFWNNSDVPSGTSQAPALVGLLSSSTTTNRAPSSRAHAAAEVTFSPALRICCIL